MAKKKKAPGRPFPKGVSGNPKGRPPLPPEVREFRKLTLSEVQGYISQIKASTVQELEAMAMDANLPGLQAWIYSIAIQGIRSGDERRFDALMDRVVGRVADQVNIHARLEAEVKAKSQAELVAEARALIAEVEGEKK